MLLSHHKKFLFVHIAKTGGTSMRKALAHYRYGGALAVPQFVTNKLSQWCGHRLGARFPRHAKLIAAYEMLPRDYFDSLYKFAVVRNPWDLQVSSYHHLKRERPHLVAPFKDFDEFTRYKLDPMREYQYHIDTSIELQSDYLVDLRGQLLVDKIAKYEQLEQDYQAICAHLGLPVKPLPHKRQATDRKPYQDYYDDDLRRLVGEYFAKDIDLFEYRFI